MLHLYESCHTCMQTDRHACRHTHIQVIVHYVLQISKKQAKKLMNVKLKNEAASFICKLKIVMKMARESYIHKHSLPLTPGDRVNKL